MGSSSPNKGRSSGVGSGFAVSSSVFSTISSGKVKTGSSFVSSGVSSVAPSMVKSVPPKSMSVRSLDSGLSEEGVSSSVKSVKAVESTCSNSPSSSILVKSPLFFLSVI